MIFADKSAISIIYARASKGKMTFYNQKLENHIKSQPRYIIYLPYISSFLDDRDQRKKSWSKKIIEFGYSLYHIEHPSHHVLEQSDWQEQSKILFQAAPSKQTHIGIILKDSL